MQLNKEQFVKGEKTAIFGILTLGTSFVIELLFVLGVINSNIVLIYCFAICTVISIPIISYGCFFMAKGKGYHPAFGLLLSLIFFGPVILSYLPYRKTKRLEK